MPKVSVVIPTYNRASFIEQAIQSVLAQSFRDFDIIVVDDGSTDNTWEVLKKFNGKIRYSYQHNQGISTARNAAIGAAQGDYIAFLDSDDYWAPKKLARQVNVLETHAAVGLVYGRMPIINSQGQAIGMKPSGICGRNFKELLELWGDLPTSTVMVRRSCFLKIGLFDTSLATMEDIDMWIRIARYFDLYEIEGKPLAYYRRHEGQKTKKASCVYEGLVKIHAKIYNTYPDCPKGLTARRIVKNQYLLAKAYCVEGDFKKALANAWAAILRCPYVGFLFIDPDDALWHKLMKPFNPYGLLMVSLVKCLTHNRYEYLH